MPKATGVAVPVIFYLILGDRRMLMLLRNEQTGHISIQNRQ